jgi:hypothetical protein
MPRVQMSDITLRVSWSVDGEDDVVCCEHSRSLRSVVLVIVCYHSGFERDATG